ncbi:MAG TPA: hypothetical protein VHZ99_14370 [Steroidobacteraceae bacterium]|jgi:hypothetical protein|nr:hypothetical protein [Steroidobacteraceae bacterium]
MKTNRHSFALSLAVTTLAMMTLSVQAEARTPRSAGSTVTRTGPYGNSSTRQSSLGTNGQGGYSAGSTLTGPAGRTTTRQQSGSYNAATQTYTRSGTTTYPNGQQSNFSTSVQATGDGYTRSSTRNGPAGNSVNTQGQGSYNPTTGTLNQSRVTTGPLGNSSNESRTVQAQ